MAETYRCKPSDLLHIKHKVLAFYFDRAVFTFAQRLQQELDSVGNKKSRSEAQQAMARQFILNRWLGLEKFKTPNKNR